MFVCVMSVPGRFQEIFRVVAKGRERNNGPSDRWNSLKFRTDTKKWIQTSGQFQCNSFLVILPKFGFWYFPIIISNLLQTFHVIPINFDIHVLSRRCWVSCGYFCHSLYAFLRFSSASIFLFFQICMIFVFVLDRYFLFLSLMRSMYVGSGYGRRLLWN